MSRQIPGGLAHHIRGMAALWQDDPRSDDQLLTAFADAGDQSAFTTLVCRHGATVWAVCRSILTESADAEDAFQATFITLARKCREARPESVAGWLAHVAHDASLDVRKASHRREMAHKRLCEQTRPQSDEPPSVSDDEFRAAMHEELAGLPLGLRAPLALYYLEGKTQPEIGRILGMPNQTVSYRICKGLSALRKRLAKRGMVVNATILVALLGGVPIALAMPPGLMTATTAAAIQAAVTAPSAAASAGLLLSPLAKMLMIGVVVGVATVVGLWTRPSANNSEVNGCVRMDEQPLACAEVVLVPDHGESRQCKTVRTFTDGGGRFHFEVGSGKDQVVPGHYRVLVLDRVLVQPTQPTWVVPPEYCTVLQTPLRLDVGAIPMVFDIPIAPVFRQSPSPSSSVEPDLSPGPHYRSKLRMALWTVKPDKFGWLE